MLGLFQSALIAVIGFFIAFLGVFGLHTEQASAPSERPPAIISESEIQREPASETEAVPVPAKENKNDVGSATVLSPPITKPTSTPATPELPAAVQPSPPVTVSTSVAPSALNEIVRQSVVNIFCTSELSGPFNSVSASGVLVDPRGVILTNAHVAQYFLLRNYPNPGTMNCVVRTGAPAVPRYTAELLFLPPSWIEKNADKINDENPLGTGEHDYALVRITGVVNNQNELPVSFSYLPLSTVLPTLGEDMLVVGYPAGFLDGITLQRELYQTSAFTKVRELMTFVESTLDLFSIGGSVVAQSGASGGAVTNLRGELTGVVVTSTSAPDTASRDLRAITISYLFRDFQNEAGETFASYISGDLKEKTKLFQATKELALIDQLKDAIGNN